MALRGAPISISFGLIFILIVVLARATAVETPAPWFSPNISTNFYEVTLLAAALMALGLAGIAGARVARFDTAVRDVDVEVALVRTSMRALSSGSGASGATSPSADARAASLLEDLGIVEGTSGTVERVGHDTVIDLSAVTRLERLEAKQAHLEELREQRARLLELRGHVWPSVVGPIALAVLFVAISGTMLPGVEGFLVSNFRLNTAFILLIAYAWWLLVGWAVVAVAMLPTEATEATAFRSKLLERVL